MPILATISDLFLFQGKYTLRIEARDHGLKPQSTLTEVHIHVDESQPLGLHNDFLLGLGADGGRGVTGGTSGGLFGGLEGEKLVVIYIVAGICFVCLSLLIAGIIFCRRMRPAGRRRTSGGRPMLNKSNGFVEANSNAHDAGRMGSSGCYQNTDDVYKPSGELVDEKTIVLL